mmetsp:Transcript_32563/g.36924  ORF Transcript_32563/g.36924 Transcript_32563/m.36924 type:complete len:267 (-) Transcript_32563:245-1045(-)
MSRVKSGVFLVFYFASFAAILYFLIINKDTREAFFDFLNGEAHHGGVIGFTIIALLEFLIIFSGHHCEFLEFIIGYIYPLYLSIPCMITGQIVNILASYAATILFLKDYVAEKTKKSKFLKGLKAALSEEERTLIFLSRFTFLPLPVSNFFLPALGVSFWNYLVYGFLGFAPKSIFNAILSSSSRDLVEHLIYGTESNESSERERLCFYIFLAMFIIFMVYGCHLTSQIRKKINELGEQQEEAEDDTTPLLVDERASAKTDVEAHC